MCCGIEYPERLATLQQCQVHVPDEPCTPDVPDAVTSLVGLDGCHSICFFCVFLSLTLPYLWLVGWLGYLASWHQEVS